MVGEEAHLLELLRGVERRRRLVREDAQRLQPLRRRDEPVLRVVRPDEAHLLAVPVVERHEQPVVVPGVRAAAVALRAVLDVIRVDALARRLVRHEVAAGDFERRVEERPHRIERHRAQHGRVVRLPTGRRARAQQSGLHVDELDRHLLEAERGVDARGRPSRGSPASTARPSASTTPRAAARGSRDGARCAPTAAPSRSRSPRAPRARTGLRARRRFGRRPLRGSPTEKIASIRPSESSSGTNSSSSGCHASGSSERLDLRDVAASRRPRSSRTIRAGSGTRRRGGTRSVSRCRQRPTRRCCPSSASRAVSAPVDVGDAEVVELRPVEVEHDGLELERLGDRLRRSSPARSSDPARRGPRSSPRAAPARSSCRRTPSCF